jgi:multidrug efflux pump subunit AcrB
MPAREDPQITIRIAKILTKYPGLSARRMELLVTKTLEESIRSISEIKEITSISMQGTSIITVEIQDRYFNLDQIWDELRDKVSEAQAYLPAGTSTPAVNSDFGDVAAVTAALTADAWTMSGMYDIAQHIRDQLFSVHGTKKVEVIGAQAERIFVEFSNARVAELGLDPSVIAADLAEQNVIRPGGEIDTGPRSFIIEPTGNFTSVEQLRNALVRGPEGPIALRDIAEVRRGFVDPPQQASFFNGKPAIIFAVSMLDGFSVLEYGPRLLDKFTELELTLPLGYELDIATYQADQVASAVYGVSSNVLQTLVIVLVVVVIFLGLRTGLIVGAIVPGVMLITVAIMGQIGMELERMSLATLIIALGLLVDNGIVVAEDIKRRLQEGESRDAAVAATGRGLAVPLLISTLTTVLVFFPLMLAEHVAGEYTRSISLVILISLVTSWVLAMMVTPALCHAFIKTDAAPTGGPPKRTAFDYVNAGYGWSLRLVLRARVLFLLVMVGLLVASVYALSKAPQKFFPDSDRPQTIVYIDLPAGVTARTTQEAMERVFATLDEVALPGLLRYAAYVGHGGPRFVLSLSPDDPAPSKAFMVLQFDNFSNSNASHHRLREMFAYDFPELQARVSGMFLGPSDSSKIEVDVKGPDADHIYAMAARVEDALREVEGAINIYTNWRNKIPKIEVIVDQTRARRVGVTSADVARSLEAYYSGFNITEFREGDDVFPIVSRALDIERSELERLQTIQVYSQVTGARVPLNQIAQIEVVADFGRIDRKDMTRTITIEAKNLLMTAEDMVPLVAPTLDTLRQDLAPGHEIEFTGVVDDSSEAQAALSANVPVCIALIILLLVGQFNSYLRPLIILATIPLVLTGAAIGIYAFGFEFGFMPLLGLYSLAGIIINNAIVLIDRIDLERTSGTHASDFDALVMACALRLRPIIMTTVTTILGFLPIIVSKDALFYGLAALMASGLAVGTVMTLGVVPVLYSLIFNIKRPRKLTKI